MIKKASYWIEKLQLEPHPEGGYFKETYRSNTHISHQCLPEKYSGDRNSATSIYFLLESTQVSSFHRLKSDELWFYQHGNAVQIYMLHDQDGLRTVTLGPNLDQQQELQVVIPAGTVFGADGIHHSGFSLMGCVVTPGFNFNDFELLSRDFLLTKYPLHKELITRLTKK
jgi:uncharacterized protein